MSVKLGLWLALTFLTFQVALSSSSWWKCKCFSRNKKSITRKHQAINNPSELTLSVKNQLINNLNEPPPDSSFQKMRWFHCWMLRSQRKVSNHITRLILSYLTFSPVTSQLCSYRHGLVETAISRNSRWLLSTTYHNSLHLCDLATKEIVRTFTAPTPALCSCAIADNHSFVAAGGWVDIYVWNTSSEKLVTTLTGHTSKVCTCSIFFNDTRLASGSYDQTVRVWQVEDSQWKNLYVLKGHTDIIMSIFTLADNPLIISFAGRDDKTLRVWNSDSGHCLQILTGHTINPSQHSCVMSLDHRLVGSIDCVGRETKVWDLNTGTCKLTIPNIFGRHNWNMHYIGYLSTTRLVWWFLDYNNNKVGVWNLLAHENVYTLLYELPIKLVSVSADDKYLTIVLKQLVSGYAFVQVHDFETGMLIESQERKTSYD